MSLLSLFKRTPVEPEERLQSYLSATQWQLIWWRFKKHRMAVVGCVILGIFAFIAIFANQIGNYDKAYRNSTYLSGPPMGIHFFDDEGKFSLRPFVYARVSKRDPVTLRRVPTVDTSEKWPVEFFVRTGKDYSMFFGLIKTNIRLFGVTGEDRFLHLFGTDNLGRDVFSRLMHATQVSLSVGVLGVIISFILGLAIGGLAGFFGGRVDSAIMRCIDFLRAIPTLPLWLGLSAALPRDWTNVQVYLAITIILAFIGWTRLARTVRSKMLALREEDFVMAARFAGCSTPRIISRHMLPSFASYLIVDITIALPNMILGETALSFLGLGLREPSVSWGVLLNSAQNISAIAHSPWLLIPALFVIIAVLAFSFVGDGLRDSADPYSR